MSGNDYGGEDRSSHDDPSASNFKRRRIAFSCLDCRRRKLKCDRLLPSCSRCQKKGATCHYDSEAVESGLRQPLNERTNGARNGSFEDDIGVDGPANRLPSVARSFAADAVPSYPVAKAPEDLVSRLQVQDERIRQLENRIIGLENATHGGSRYRQDLVSSSRSTNGSGRPIADSEDRAEQETMIFRGKSFKTQFYGASHPASYLSHVCAHMRCPRWIWFTDKYSSRNCVYFSRICLYRIQDWLKCSVNSRTPRSKARGKRTSSRLAIALLRNCCLSEKSQTNLCKSM